jgi:two-component system nitrate/nitrite response regulator NarL
VAPLRILIVDDKPRIRSGIRMLLKKHPDWTICGEASDGIEAIQQAAEFRPDVILLDVFMPRMDGMTALPLIREKSPSSQIIVLTVDQSLDTARAASCAGAHAYIAKSLMTKLLAVLEDLQPNQTHG